MKNLLASLIIAAALSHAYAQTDLLSLGSATFSIDSGSTGGIYSQSATGITFNATVAGGDTVYNDVPFTPVTSYNWSGFSNYGIRMSLLGGSPISLAFTVEFFDASFASIDKYDGDTSSLVTIGSPVNIDFTGINTPGSGNYSSVQYLQFSWAGGGAVNVEAQKIYGVPEPSTYALLALSGLALGRYAMRRRRRS